VDGHGAGRGACFNLSGCSKRMLITFQILARSHAERAVRHAFREEVRGRCHYFTRERNYIDVTFMSASSADSTGHYAIRDTHTCTDWAMYVHTSPIQSCSSPHMPRPRAPKRHVNDRAWTHNAPHLLLQVSARSILSCASSHPASPAAMRFPRASRAFATTLPT
jgi:hypothetical protein